MDDDCYKPMAEVADIFVNGCLVAPGTCVAFDVDAGWVEVLDAAVDIHRPEMLPESLEAYPTLKIYGSVTMKMRERTP